MPRQRFVAGHLPARERIPGPHRHTRKLGVVAGFVGSVAFVAIFTIEGWLRPGYDRAADVRERARARTTRARTCAREPRAAALV